MSFPKVVANTYAHIKSKFAIVKQVTNGLHKKPSFLIIALFILFGTGGVIAATSISINSGSAISLGAGYSTATACDENVTLNAQTALDASSGQLYVATIALSDISQNPTTGCGNKTMEMALKINGQMTYASWDIPSSFTDSTFNFSAATISLSDYNAMTALTPFQVDGLSNIAIAKIGSFTYNYDFNWTRRESQRNWLGIASSSDGTKLVAVDSGGESPTAYIYTSTDSGATWTPRGTPRNWLPVASSADGTKLVAADYPQDPDADANGGYIYTSTDSGETWVERSSAGLRWWQSITSSVDGTKLAAVTWEDYIYTSTDSGANWTQQLASGNRVWYSITSSSNGSKLAAVVLFSNPLYSAGGYIYTSIDYGVTWTEQTTSGPRKWQGIASSSDGTKLVAVADREYIYTSTDSGANWTEQTTSGIRRWSAITSSSDGTKLAAVDSAGSIYISTDSGVDWTVEPVTSLASSGITSSSDGSKIAAISYGGYIYTGVSGKTRSNN
jgi:photosystem II stability/assembly factor-like uncharacterized protein